MIAEDHTHCCTEMATSLADERVAIGYTAKFREYFIELYSLLGTLNAPRFDEYDAELYERDASIQQIAFCPWCGRRLPESLRDEWFQRLWQLGLDAESADIPAEMKTDAWWREG